MTQPHLTEHALTVLRARYLRKNERGEVVETPEQLFRRVAHGVARAERRYGGTVASKLWEDRFFEALVQLDFLPNSPTLMNAGTRLGQLSACFVLPVEDSIRDIFDSLKLMALIQQTGGGTGFAFSHLRPKGAYVNSTGGQASGPVSFMRIFDCATENIRLGGRRRGANMGVLRVDHPDIQEFVDAKASADEFRNFNLSVGATDAFMQADAQGEELPLRAPHTNDLVGTISATELMEHIAESAWKSGDPGMLFLDTINRANPTPGVGLIEATNPCGEVPLLPYEACNLGSINLSHMLQSQGDRQAIDWTRLAKTVGLAIRFLDDVVDIGKWPSKRIERAVCGNRKIGLGVMGFADMLIQLEIPYDSQDAIETAHEVMRFIREGADETSAELAAERGAFPNWPLSRYADQQRPMRNATRTSIAPTGTLGILAGTSASIEPLFALAYRREHVLNDATMVELHPLFVRYVERAGLDWHFLRSELAVEGTLDRVADVPEWIRRLFRTALSIPPEQHLRIQAAFQAHVDNAVSKTINLPEEVTAAEVAMIYRRAWQMGVKGVTIYRYGSKRQQVLNLGTGQTPLEREHFARCDPQACRL